MLGLSWGLGLFWLPCTGVTWTDKTRGEGQVFHSISGSIARIHRQDPSPGGFLSMQSSLVFLSKAGQLGCPNPSLTVLQQVSEVAVTQVHL